MFRFAPPHSIPTLCLVALAMGACAAQSEPRTSPRAPVETELPAEGERSTPVQKPARPPAEAEPGGVPELAPPDGKWLTDEETGRRYYLEKQPKYEGGYTRLEDGQVRLRYGFTVKPYSEDESFFYLQVWEPSDEPVERPRNPRAEPTAEERAEIAARYIGSAQQVDRIHLEPIATGLPQVGQWRNGFRLVDMNGDGHLDFVHGPMRKALAQPIVMLGDGKGSFEPWTAMRVTAHHRLDYGDIAVADFDQDGNLDLGLACHLMGVTVLRGDGAGGFAPWGTNAGLEFNVPGKGGAAESFSSRALEAADIDGDGRPDLVVLGEGPKVLTQLGRQSPGQRELPPGSSGSYGIVVYRNQGDGSWTKQLALPEHVFGDSLAIADLDGDGDLDLLSSTMASGRSGLLARQQADGTFTTENPGLEGGGLVRAVLARDLDGDGGIDLVFHRQIYERDGWHNTIDVIWRDGAGASRFERILSEGVAVAYDLDTADLDGDGLLDLLANTDSGQIAILMGTRREGRLSFDLEQSPELSQILGCSGFSVAAADLDGIGGPEIVATYGAERCQAEGSVQAWRVLPGPHPDPKGQVAIPR